jgi:hypothetical protein
MYNLLYEFRQPLDNQKITEQIFSANFQKEAANLSTISWQPCRCQEKAEGIQGIIKQISCAKSRKRSRKFD